ncbi:unnamed protein product [Ambrosiozyma monospora]|uniref:Unnamed protein product n=1 Tax=Ambrosiozyma monospora TaxID=43982 RepID=A0ACB5SYR5_AMBMO|nr:unnamed protein product [Ambrosiozyma monospora]
MLSTLKRTLTDIMEDELYTVSTHAHSHSNSHSCAQEAYQVTNRNSSQSQNQIQTPASMSINNNSTAGSMDLTQYLHLNGSQDSVSAPPASSFPTSIPISLASSPQMDDFRPLQHFTIDQMATQQQQPAPLVPESQQLQQQQQPQNLQEPRNIYNSYANPSLYTNSVFPDYMQPNNSFTAYNGRSDSMNSFDRFGNNVNSPHTIQNGSLDPKQTSTSTPESTFADDDTSSHVMVVPQDNYMIYDPTNEQQFLPELLQFELAGAGKPLPQSNELNIFKPDIEVDEVFSDDEEDDDDSPNKLEDMEMDLDDLSSESSFGAEADADDDYFMANIEGGKNSNVHNTHNRNSSIYALTVPQTINPRLVNSFQIDDSQMNERPSISMDMPHDYNLLIDDSDIEEDVVDMMSDTSDDLYTPAFEQRRESMFSSDREQAQQQFQQSQQPQELKTSQNELKNTPQRDKKPEVVSSPVLRKPKLSATSTANNSSAHSTPSPAPSGRKHTHHANTKVEDCGSGEDSHICMITNPKTGQPCNKKFSRPYDLVRHQNTIHASKRLYYRCMFCEDDLRRRNNMECNNQIVANANYRAGSFSSENASTSTANSHNSKKLKTSVQEGEFLSNKTFSRCDALTRHLRFRHGLTNQQVNTAMDYAKKHVEFYQNKD